MTGQLILCVGCPGSGKSTWAEAQRAADPENVVVVERDIIREQIGGTRQNFDHEFEVTRRAHYQVMAALEQGKTVIIADTNLNGKFRKQWRKRAESVGASYQEVKFSVPYDELVRRNIGRPSDHQVPEEVLEMFHERMVQHDRATA